MGRTIDDEARCSYRLPAVAAVVAHPVAHVVAERAVIAALRRRQPPSVVPHAQDGLRRGWEESRRRPRERLRRASAPCGGGDRRMLFDEVGQRHVLVLRCCCEGCEKERQRDYGDHREAGGHGHIISFEQYI